LVAIPRDFPPQYSLSSDGVPKGSTVEILDFVSRFSGVEFRFVVMDTWDEMLRALLGGEVDMIPNAGLSRARMKDYGVVFSEPLERFPVKTFVLKQNENTYGKLRLNDLKVGTVRSSFALTYLKRLGVHNITLFESIPDCVFALLSGEVDAVVYPQEPLLKIARDAGVAARVVQTGDSLFESKQGVAIAPGSAELLPLVNAALENIGGSGILSEIFDRWYVEKIPFWSARRVFFLMSLLLLLLTLSFFWWKTRFYKTTEEDLNARERAFMAHYNSVTSPTYTLQAKNDEFFLINYNNAAIKKSKNRISEFVGKTVSELFPGSEELGDLLRHCLQRQCSLSKELEFSQGEERIVYQTGFSFLPPDMILMNFNDVTLRKNLEKNEREYRQQLQALASALTNSEEIERRRVAEELHDSIGQNLALSKIRLVMLSQSVNDEGIRSDIAGVLGAIDDSILMTRSLTFELGTPVLYRLGFEASVHWLAEKLYDEHGLEVRFENRGLPEIMVDALKAFLFRAVRELLMNVVKHSGILQAKVVSSFSDKRILRLSVIDHGRGFDSCTTSFYRWNEASFGLFSLRERLKYLGGNMDIYSKEGQGTKVTLIVPVEAFEKGGA